MLTRLKQGSLVVCLFLFLFVVIGGGLHLNPGGAFLAAATGTPLVIHAFQRRVKGREIEQDLSLSSRTPGSVRCPDDERSDPATRFDTKSVV